MNSFLGAIPGRGALRVKRATGCCCAPEVVCFPDLVVDFSIVVGQIGGVLLACLAEGLAERGEEPGWRLGLVAAPKNIPEAGRSVGIHHVGVDKLIHATR